MKFLILLNLAIAIIALTQGKEIGTRTFKGYEVLTVEVTSPAQFEVIKSLYESGEYDFWTTLRKLGPTDIMVAPGQHQHLEQVLLDNGIKFVAKIQDVEKLVKAEKESNIQPRNGRLSWTAYPTFAQVAEFLEGLNSTIAKVSVIGKTFENRNIYSVKISSGGPPKKSVLIDANIHSREWISGTAATWIINELVTNTKAYDGILDKIDIYIIPMINADGYEWSRTNDRMWRKTRSVRPGTTCIGCDPNRNFEFKFGGEGTSANPCSEIYSGSGPFSESETVAVRDFVIATEASGVKFYAYLTFHAYSQMWLLPWGYSAKVYPEDYAEQLSLGEASIKALRAVHGTIYEVGQGADLLYGVGGASDDWAKDHGIKYTATLEMRDTGEYGFIIPAQHIIPNAEEVWAALQVVFQRVIETLA